MAGLTANMLAPGSKVSNLSTTTTSPLSSKDHVTHPLPLSLTDSIYSAGVMRRTSIGFSLSAANDFNGETASSAGTAIKPEINDLRLMFTVPPRPI